MMASFKFVLSWSVRDATRRTAPKVSGGRLIHRGTPKRAARFVMLAAEGASLAAL